MALGSVEDSVIAKLKLDELTGADKITALINYFNSVIIGKFKTNPVELKAVLNLMNDYKQLDKNNAVLGYINTHQNSIEYFFSDNMQRFDRFEFKPYFLRLKGVEPGKEFIVPVNAKRNFAQISPLDTGPYKDILEWDTSEIEQKKEHLEKIDAYQLEALREKESKKIVAAVNTLRQKIAQDLQGGKTTKEAVLEKVKFVEGQFISALHIQYNEPAVRRLSELFFAEAAPAAVEEIFSVLEMPLKQRELFCAALLKKI